MTAAGTARGGLRRRSRLTCVNLSTRTLGRVTERATIVFENGVVRRAGRGERPASGGRVIYVGGVFALPGLVDVHVHAATVAAAKLSLQRGATTVRSASTAFFQTSACRSWRRSGGSASRASMPAGTVRHAQPRRQHLADPALAPLALLPDWVRRPATRRC